MPSTEKKQQSELVSVVDSFLDEKNVGKDGEGIEFLTIIEFIDRFKLLPNGLFPVQKFILKLYYNIPLDDKDKVIKITDRFNTRVIHEMTEVQYLKYLYDQGRCNIAAQDGNVRHELVLVLGRRSGKCGDIESRVVTTSGLRTLDELLRDSGADRTKTGWHKLQVGIVQQGGRMAVTDAIYYGGRQAVRRISTYCGYGHAITPEHRLKVMEDSGNIVWKYGHELREGDFVGVNRSCQLWPDSYVDISGFVPKYTRVADINRKSHIRTGRVVRPRSSWGIRLDESLGEFLGILTGDGTWSCGKYKGLIAVTGGCEQFRPHVEGLFSKFLGGFHLKRIKKDKTTCEVSPWTVYFGSVKDRAFLDSIGFRLSVTKATKSVPWPVFQSPKSVVAAYLRGLFETDGGIEKGTSITMCSHSKQLCRDVQDLLLNFGIVCRVKPKYNKKFKSTNYVLNLLGSISKKIFATDIGFITPRKNAALARSLVNASSGCSDTESVPHLRGKLRQLRDSIPKSTNNMPGRCFRPRSEIKELMGDAAKPGSAEALSYSRLQHILDFSAKWGASLELRRELQDVVDSNYFWDPIVSVQDDEVEVADLSVPDGESYVAAGMTNHNSTISAIVASYELYKLLRRRNPQLHYGIPANSEIRVLCIANDKEQASIVFGDMSGYVDNVDYFKTSRTNQTQTFMRFQTDNDRQRYGTSKGARSTITATFKSSIAKGLRGRGIICYILDEVAFFVDNGKCERLFSIVQTDSGPVSLEQILAENDIDKSRIGWTDIRPFEVAQECGRRAWATRIYYGGIQKTRYITTKSRYSIEPTPEHRLKVMSLNGNIEWKYVRDIAPGDFVGINRETRLWPLQEFDCSRESIGIAPTRLHRVPFPSFIDPGFGEFLGILVGGGTWSAGKDKSLVQVTGGCEQFLPHVESHFLRYVGGCSVRRKTAHEHSTCEVSTWSAVKHSLPFRTFLDRLGYRLDAKKSTKSVPWVIFKSSKPVVAAFLRGLFETGGRLEHGGSAISFATASSKLATEVQLLLLNFGITSSVHVKTNKNYPGRNYYCLRVIGHESRKIFAREIRFITERKNTDLDHGAGSGRDASNVIPNQYARLRRILESVPHGSTQKKGDGPRIRITKLISSSADPERRSAISYDSARRLVSLGRELGADVVALDELDAICRANYFWDSVVSVKESEGEVADLLVPNGHEYVAQGMTNHNSSADQVYRAVNPSIAQFSPKDPKNKHRATGPSDGRAIMISSPDARDGFFYHQYQLALSGGVAAKNMLMLQAPTWEVNPTLDKSYYEVEFNKDPRSFMTEHGAEFSDRVRGWIEDSRDLIECVRPGLRPLVRGAPRELFWAGVDFGIVRDGTAIALIHFVNGRLELAYHEVWYAGKSWKTANPHLSVPPTEYAKNLEGVSRLDVAEIAEWFRILSSRFYIDKGVFDQWAGPIFEQELHKRGLKQFEMRNFSVTDSSHAYHIAKMCMFGRQLSLYDYPLPQQMESDSTMMKHSPLISEMLELQATSGGKNITVVEAPKVAGKHDDQSDALVRGVLLAAEYIKAHPGVLEISANHITSPVQQVAAPSSYHRYHSMRARMHGGPDKHRTVTARR
jgi:intein/homing endonuclease